MKTAQDVIDFIERKRWAIEQELIDADDAETFLRIKAKLEIIRALIQEIGWEM